LTEDLLYRLAIFIHVLVVFECTQAAFNCYSLSIRLFSRDRGHPWLPALVGMVMMTMATAFLYILYIVTDVLRDPAQLDIRLSTVLGILFIISARLKIVTVWRVDYDMPALRRIMCFVAELIAVAAVTVGLNILYGI
jgi:hypothetical protein